MSKTMHFRKPISNMQYVIKIYLGLKVYNETIVAKPQMKTIGFK